MSLLASAGKRWLARFGQHKMKNVRNYLKTKMPEELNYTSDMSEDEKVMMANSHRLLYSIYIPSLLLGVPAVYFLGNAASPLFYQSVNLLQYYASGVLCYNSFFTIQKEKLYIPFLIGVGLANTLTGPYSVISPIILGVMNFYFPFTDEEMHKAETSSQQDKLKTYMNSQAIFYFLITVITTLKCYHFFSAKQLQKKLDGFQKENEEYFSTINQEVVEQ